MYNAIRYSNCCRLYSNFTRNQYHLLSPVISQASAINGPHYCVYKRHFSSDRKGFFGQVLDNIKQEIAKNKEMKENIKKFREEAQKLEESDALKKAREKFEAIEAETTKGSEKVKEQFKSLKEKFRETIEEASKSDLGKQGLKVGEEIVKQARVASEQLAKQGQQLGDASAFKAVSEGVKAIKEEVEDVTISGPSVYKPPKKLRKRTEQLHASDKPIEVNTEATGVELHKDSKWYKSWENFKENNQYVNKVFDWKMKYDESDSPIVRASRLVTDKLADMFGGVFRKTELSEALTEICKMDPNFDKASFLRECEVDIIPNILEAMVRGDLEILQDWCHESAYSRLKVPIDTATKLGYKLDSKVLDISHVDLAMGQIMEQGPVLIITFQTQQIMCVRDGSGNVIEGDPDKILRFHYVWVLCRDQEELNPKAAWRLLDLSANSQSQWL
ncbi:mitochondrial import inner membrane translocase subunit TIM44 [Tetranychus urticae]|uniref:mitochondrial import inner membrane translocase subunit TIM44 n=1 Tax=Tetranychus urticae TaxID=32264 RepID=UPI00077BFFA4|nr:mitochondrial import inner membrane translocase subunit TIM44 [Tetranychus urticae]